MWPKLAQRLLLLTSQSKEWTNRRLGRHAVTGFNREQVSISLMWCRRSLTNWKHRYENLMIIKSMPIFGWNVSKGHGNSRLISTVTKTGTSFRISLRISTCWWGGRCLLMIRHRLLRHRLRKLGPVASSLLNIIWDLGKALKCLSHYPEQVRELATKESH